MKKTLITVLLMTAVLILLPRHGISSSQKILKVTEFSSFQPDNEAPPGWQVQKHKGNPSFKVERFGDHVYLRMKSSGHTAFGVRKQLSVDIRQYPYLHWTWRAQRLPAGGDVRRADRDDQALQVYLIFQVKGFLNIMKSPAMAYIWDNEAPKSLVAPSPQKRMGYVRYMVLRNNADALGRWQREKRNLYEDYKIMFKDIDEGKPPGPIQVLLLFINTHHTRSDADCYIGEMYFSTKGE